MGVEGMFFSVKSAYISLQAQLVPMSTNSLADLVFESFWRCYVPSKVLALSWRLLLDRLPSCVALFRRRVITDQQGLSCVLCNLHQEDSIHSSFTCQVSLLTSDLVFCV